MPAKMKLKSGATATFNLVDIGDDQLGIEGVDSANNPVDLTGLGTAAWSVTQADGATPSVALTVTSTGPGAAKMSAIGPLTTGDIVTCVFTPTDTTQPAITGTMNVNVVAGGPTGLQIVTSVPTTH
jgi:hypothetical protein